MFFRIVYSRRFPLLSIYKILSKNKAGVLNPEEAYIYIYMFFQTVAMSRQYIRRVLSYNPTFILRKGRTRPVKAIFYSLVCRVVQVAGLCACGVAICVTAVRVRVLQRYQPNISFGNLTVLMSLGIFQTLHYHHCINLIRWISVANRVVLFRDVCKAFNCCDIIC